MLATYSNCPKHGVLLHTKKLSPFSLQRWRALSKFKAHIETGGQTINSRLANPQNEAYLGSLLRHQISQTFNAESEKGVVQAFRLCIESL